MKLKLTSFISIVVVLIVLFGLRNIHDKTNTIKQLEQQLEYKQIEIDNLCIEIDTLIEKTDHILYWEWDSNDLIHSSGDLLSALIMGESRNNDLAYAEGEDAVGCLQIRKCMVDDVNRILKRQKSTLSFTYNDRWLRHKSIQMFQIYCKHYNLTTDEEIARCWNGGPRGMSNELTVNYWRKVKENLDS